MRISRGEAQQSGLQALQVIMLPKLWESRSSESIYLEVEKEET